MKSLLVPCQVRRYDADERPYHQLWQAVLFTALKDLQGSAPSGYSDCERRQQEARRRFESPATRVGSLNWNCEMNNLDAGSVRRYALGAHGEIAPRVKYLTRSLH